MGLFQPHTQTRRPPLALSARSNRSVRHDEGLEVQVETVARVRLPGRAVVEGRIHRASGIGVVAGTVPRGGVLDVVDEGWGLRIVHENGVLLPSNLGDRRRERDDGVDRQVAPRGRTCLAENDIARHAVADRLDLNARHLRYVECGDVERDALQVAADARGVRLGRQYRLTVESRAETSGCGKGLVQLCRL